MSSSCLLAAGLDRVVCPLCNASEWAQFSAYGDEAWFLGFPDDASILRCGRCDFRFLYPPSVVEDRYETSYFDGHLEFRAGTPLYKSRQLTFEERLGLLEARLPGRGRILDVGCAEGHFLQVAIQRGWHAVGVDASESAIERARSAGLEVHACEVSQLPYVSQTFDAVHSNHVLEHIERPLPVLQAACRFLKPGGWLYIEVPNELDHLSSQIARWFGRRTKGGGLFGEARRRDTPSPHLGYFSRRSISWMLAAAELNQIRVCTREEANIGELLAHERAAGLHVGLRRLGARVGAGTNLVAVARKL